MHDPLVDSDLTDADSNPTLQDHAIQLQIQGDPVIGRLSLPGDYFASEAAMAEVAEWIAAVIKYVHAGDVRRSITKVTYTKTPVEKSWEV